MCTLSKAFYLLLLSYYYYYYSSSNGNVGGGTSTFVNAQSQNVNVSILNFFSGSSKGAEDEFAMYQSFIVEQAVNDINANPIIPGLTIQLDQIDPNFERTVIVTKMIDYIQTTNRTLLPSIGILGERWSSRSEALNLVASAYHHPQCSGSATSPALSEKSVFPTFFRTTPNDNFQATALMHLIKSFGWNRVAIVSETGSYGQSLSEKLIVNAETFNVTILAHVTIFEQQEDFSSEISILKESGVRIIISIWYPKEAMLFLRQAEPEGIVGSDFVYICTDSVWRMGNDIEQVIPLVEGDNRRIEGVLIILPQSDSNNQIYMDLKQRIADKYGEENSDVAYGGNWYDCVFAIVHTFKNYLDRTGTTIQEFLAMDPQTERMNLTDTIAIKDVQGAVGPLGFDKNGEPQIIGYTLNNIQFHNGEKKFLKVGTLDGISGEYKSNGEQIYFYGGTTEVPKDSSGEFIFNFTDPGPLLFTVCFGLLLIVFLSSHVLLFWKRKSRTVRTMSYPFLQIIDSGLTIGAISAVIGFIGRATEVSCIFQQWGLWISFGTVISGFTAKVFRVWRLFDNRGLENRIIKNHQLMLFTGSIVLGEIVILSVWTGIDMLKPTLIFYRGYSFYVCASENIETQQIASYALFVYNGLLLVFVMFLAFKTRNVNSIYRESQWISYVCMYLSLAATVSTIIVNFSGNNILIDFYVRMVATLFSLSLTYYCLIGRIVTQLFIPETQKIGGSSFKDMLQGPGKYTNGSQSISSQGQNGAKVEVFFTTVVTRGSSIFSTWKAQNLYILGDFCIILPLDAASKDRLEKNRGIGLACSKVSVENDPESDNFKIATHGKTITIQCNTSQEKKKLLGFFQSEQQSSNGQSNAEENPPLPSGSA